MYKSINIHQKFYYLLFGISLSISIREPKLVIVYRRSCFKYKSINIHQRTKTNHKAELRDLKYKSINIHQRTKTARYGIFCGFGA